MPPEVIYVQASAADPNTPELNDVVGKMQDDGYALVHVAPAQDEGGVTAGLWLFFAERDGDSQPPPILHFEPGSLVSTTHPEFGPHLTLAGQGAGAQTPAFLREVRAKKGLGASLTVTGLAAVILGIVLHFALRSDLIGTALHLGYFFGVVGLILFLIGLLIVF